MRADLHIHTYYSADGIGRPALVFEVARAAGLDVIAITEHNSSAHIDECHALAETPGAPRYVPAMEVSCTTSWTGTQEVHLLCYFVDAAAGTWRSTEFRKLIDTLAGVQHENLHRIASEIGVGAEEVNDIVAWCRELGHIHPSVAPSVYFLRRRYTAREPEDGGSARSALSAARRRLRDSGRLAPYPVVQYLGDLMGRGDCRWFLAHPARYGLSDALLAKLVGELAEMGLAGIEVHYLGSMEAGPRFAEIARHYRLCRSVGTDLHSFENVSAATYVQAADLIAAPPHALEWLWPLRS